MIVGVGTDIIEIQRVASALKHRRFITRNFSADEQLLFGQSQQRVERIALNFAVKEAFVKALGTGFRQLSLIDIAVLRNDAGKPYIQRTEKLQQLLTDKGIDRVHVSGSHCRAYATATVIVECCEEK